jgi:2'-5' RNA ligase
MQAGEKAVLDTFLEALGFQEGWQEGRWGGNSMRTFIAIELPAPVCRRIAQQQRTLAQHLRAARANQVIRWTAADNLHLTLRFLGETDEVQRARIHEGLAAAASGHAPLRLAVSELGCFPSFRRPSIVWLGFLGDVRRLAQLHIQIEAAAQAAGFAAEERAFTPHLTIGRAQRSAAAADLQRAGDVLRQIVATAPAQAPAAAFDFVVDRVVFMRSELRPSGPIYTPLEVYPLGGLPG